MGYFGIPFRNGVPIGLGSVVSFGAQQFDPSELFVGGTAGAWYDPSDLSTMFDTSAGTTPVAMPGQGAPVPVGLMLDKSQGLVLGSELVTNGDFSGGTTSWTFGSNWTVTGGAATTTGANSDPTTGRPLTQSASLVVGRTYEISFELVANNFTGTSCSVRFQDNGNINLQIVNIFPSTPVGVYKARLAATGTNITITTSAASPAGSFTIDNISVRELPGNHAIAFNNTSARPVLMARVNLLTYSEEFDNGAWTKSSLNPFGSGSVANTTATLDPLGGNTADFIQENNAFAGHSVSQTVSNVGVNYIFTCYAKVGGRAFVRLKYFDSANNRYGAVFDLSTGGATNDPNTGSGVIVSSSALSAGNGWWRLTITGNAPTIAGATFAISMATSATTTNQPSVSYTGDGTSGIYIWGADLRPANIGANVPAYQRIADANTYDTSGFPLYLFFDGIDDSMYTPANLNLSGTDKVAVFAGVRKLSDAVVGLVAETSSNSLLNAGAFGLFDPASGTSPNRTYSFRSESAIAISSPEVLAPTTYVSASQANRAAPSIIVRRDGVQVGSTTASQGVGNFGTYPLYVGSRNNSSLFFNGHLHSLIIAGSAVSAGNISATEQWVAGKTGVQI